MVADVYLVQVDGVVDVVPHVVVTLDMVVKSTGPAFKFMARYTADKAQCFLVFLSTILYALCEGV